MNAQQQMEVLQNALNSFGLTNLTLYPKISEDKRLKNSPHYKNSEVFLFCALLLCLNPGEIYFFGSVRSALY